MAGRELLLPVSVGVVGLALIIVGQTVPNRHSIENDLTNRSLSALQTAGLINVGVDFTGRDATIRLTASAADVAQVKSVVGAVEGVRVVTVHEIPTQGATVTVGSPVLPGAPATPVAAETVPATPSAAPTPTPTPTPTSTPTPETTPTPAPTPTSKAVAFPVGFTLVDGTITVTGTVGSQASRKALISTAKAAGHGWKVVDKLAVDTSLSAVAPKANRLPAVTELLAKAPIGGSQLVIQYNHDKVVLRGAPSSSKIEFSLLRAAAGTVGGTAKVTDGLDVS